VQLEKQIVLAFMIINYIIHCKSDTHVVVFIGSLDIFPLISLSDIVNKLILLPKCSVSVTSYTLLRYR